jgi:hypothetical protein
MRAHTGLCLLSAIAGCGSGVPPGADTLSDPPRIESSGSEVSAPSQARAEVNAPSEARAEPPATGPASMLLRATVDGKPVAAHVRVLDAKGGSVAEGPTGSPLELRAGTYRAEISIDAAEALADRPTQTRELFIQPGKQTEIEASFPWSKIQLNVLVSGHAHNGATIKLIRNGAVVAEMKSGAKPALISPGKYEADVVLQGTTIRVKGLLFPENGAQTVPVRVQF